jgi:hypothetical protein
VLRPARSGRVLSRRPETQAEKQLRRLANIAATGRATCSLTVPRDWSRLWWVRVDGPALGVSRPARARRALAALALVPAVRRPTADGRCRDPAGHLGRLVPSNSEAGRRLSRQAARRRDMTISPPAVSATRTGSPRSPASATRTARQDNEHHKRTTPGPAG